MTLGIDVDTIKDEEWISQNKNFPSQPGDLTRGRWSKCTPYVKRQENFYYCKMICEVKIALVGIGDVIRQLNLYKSYYHVRSRGSQNSWLPYGLLFAPWDLSGSDLSTLESSDWCSEQKDAKPPTHLEV